MDGMQAKRKRARTRCRCSLSDRFKPGGSVPMAAVRIPLDRSDLPIRKEGNGASGGLLENKKAVIAHRLRLYYTR